MHYVLLCQLLKFYIKILQSEPKLINKNNKECCFFLDLNECAPKPAREQHQKVLWILLMFESYEHLKLD